MAEKIRGRTGGGGSYGIQGYRRTQNMAVWFSTWGFKRWRYIKGVIKYYVLSGCRVDEIVDDIVYRTNYGLDGVREIKEKVEKVLEEAAGID